MNVDIGDVSKVIVVVSDADDDTTGSFVVSGNTTYAVTPGVAQALLARGIDGELRGLQTGNVAP